MSDSRSEPIPLGPFRLERRIGRGGMAEVWTGCHAVQRVPVAVKVMTGERARDPQYRASFRNEVQSVASLDHPGIVLVFDHGEVGVAAEEASRGLLPAGSPCLAMELSELGTLASHAPRIRDWPGLRRILLALLDALAHAHARGVVHRDLKPSNVLLFAPVGDAMEPRLKLADFGLAQAFELQVGPESTDFVCGTPTYMAPEQLRGEWRDYGPWTDLYGLGCLAWALATGWPPFTDPGLLQLVRLQLEEDPPAFEPLFPMPRGFEGFLRRLLQKEAGHRFVRAADATWTLLRLSEPARRESSIPDRPSEEPATEVLTLTGLLPAARERLAPPPPVGTDAEPPCPRESPPLPETWEHPATRPPSMQLVGAGLGLYGLRSIPLVGRRAERDRLWQVLAQVHHEPRVRLVLLRGAAGNGKTRLAEWIAERAHEVGGATVLRASHGPSPGAGDGLPRMMARHLRCVGLTRGEIVDRTRRLLSIWKLDDEAEAEALAELMAPMAALSPNPGEDAGHTGSRLLRPQTAAERFDLIERRCRRLARQRPVLILLDDLHWSVESIAFADHLLRIADLPVLILATVRDEALAERRLESAAIAELLALPGASELEVPPLSPGERAALVQQLLGLSGELAAQVEERTRGNPLFAVQLVGDWVQRGVLEVGETGFVLRSGEEARFPDDLHQVWSGRVGRLLDGLPAGSREALEIAAALGPDVDRKEWETASRAVGSPAPPQLLDRLLASHLAVRTEEGWRFVHPMLRESLERMAREAGRWPGHNRGCAAMLLGRAAAGERGIAERLGRHLLLAGQPAPAVDFLLRGAGERRETSDYAAAQSLLAQRDDVLQHLSAGRRDPRWGDGWVLRARIHLHQGQLDEVFRWAGRAVTGGTEAEWIHIRSDALRLLGDAARRRGNLKQAVELYERCLSTEAPHGVAASLWGLADVLRQRGDLERARELFDRSERLYEEIGDDHGMADHWIGLADLARQRRDAAGAESWYRKARDRFDALGNQYGVARSLNGLGEAARLRNDLARAGGLYLQSLGILERLSSADGLFPRVNLALVDLGGGRFGEAREGLEEIRRQLDGLGWGGLLACVHAGLLACAAQARAWGAWETSFGRLTELLAASGLQDPDITWCTELSAKLAEDAGREAWARAARGLVGR